MLQHLVSAEVGSPCISLRSDDELLFAETCVHDVFMMNPIGRRSVDYHDAPAFGWKLIGRFDDAPHHVSGVLVAEGMRFAHYRAPVAHRSLRDTDDAYDKSVRLKDTRGVPPSRWNA